MLGGTARMRRLAEPSLVEMQIDTNSHLQPQKIIILINLHSHRRGGPARLEDTVIHTTKVKSVNIFILLLLSIFF